MAYAETTSRLWWWVAAAVLLIAGLLGLWLMGSDRPTPPPPVAVAAGQPVQTAITPVSEPQPVESVAIAEDLPPQKPVEPARPAAPPSPPPPPPREVRKPQVTPPKPAFTKSLLAWSERPEAIRREQPELTVGGAMYSVDAASRMLIVNGQVLREGDSITPDLVLEKINLKSAVLAYKGQHYMIRY